jgi:hypothetical protein
MIKTLRITSVLAVLLACVILAVPLVFQKRSNPQAEELLKAETAVEKFSKTQNRSAAKKDAQLSPLVKQAQTFANFLNPPRPEPSTQQQLTALEVRPQMVTPKFTLVGTSVSAVRPEMSMALIDEPGKGTYWVKQASQVGHLTIEQIKNGLIVVNDNRKTSEIVADRPEKISLLRNPPSAQTSISGQAAPTPPELDLGAPFEEISKELEAIEKQVAAGLLDANEAALKSAAVMEKFEAATKAVQSQINAEEAKSIGQLGDQLNAKQGGNSIKPAAPQHPKTQQVAPKTEPKNSAQQKPIPRQRDPRRRGIRPRRGAPRQIQDANNPNPQ